VTHLLQDEDGPWDLFVRLRRALGEGLLGKMLGCFYCLSVWIALPLAYWTTPVLAHAAIVWPALSGAAILLERLTSRPEPAVTWHEDPAPGSVP